jgi:hypothetical protein
LPICTGSTVERTVMPAQSSPALSQAVKQS